MPPVYTKLLGTGDPLFLLESGFAATHLSWMGIAPALAANARVFLYDRPGFGHSTPRPEPRSAMQCATELASIAPPEPAIVLAHSFGCLIARLYAESHPSRVRALLLLDPIRLSEFHPRSRQSIRRILRGTFTARALALAARLGILSSLTRKTEPPANVTGGDGGSPRRSFALNRVLQATSQRRSTTWTPRPLARLLNEIAKLPPETWPDIRRHWSQPGPFVTFRRYLECIEASCAAGACFTSLGAIPLTVISRSNLTPEHLRENERWAAVSTTGRHVVAPSAGHWVHLDCPELVLQEAALLAARTRTPTA